MSTMSTMQGSNHLAKLIEEKCWNLVISRCQTHPRETRTKTVFLMGVANSKARAIHFACESNPPVNVIQEIVRAYPKGIREQETKLGLLPLHIACSEGASLAVVRELLRLFPQGCQTSDFQGRLPLHYALANHAARHIVTELIRFWPEGAKVSDAHGWMPLHSACAFAAPPIIIDKLIDIFPDSVLIKTKAGKLPLDYARDVKPPIDEVIKILMRNIEQLDEKENVCAQLTVHGSNKKPSKNNVKPSMNILGTQKNKVNRAVSILGCHEFV